MTTPEIRKSVPDWLVWTHGCPGGETVRQVCVRADKAIGLALDNMESRDVVFAGHTLLPRGRHPVGRAAAGRRSPVRDDRGVDRGVRLGARRSPDRRPRIWISSLSVIAMLLIRAMLEICGSAGEGAYLPEWSVKVPS